MSSTLPPGVREGIKLRQLGKELIALDTLDGHVHQLNETATLIWQMKHSGRSEQGIAECLSTAYEVDRENALNHVVTIVTQLRAIGLLPPGTAK